MQEPTAGKQMHLENASEKVMFCEKQAPTSFVVNAKRHFGEIKFRKYIAIKTTYPAQVIKHER